MSTHINKYTAITQGPIKLPIHLFLYKYAYCILSIYLYINIRYIFSHSMSVKVCCNYFRNIVGITLQILQNAGLGFNLDELGIL